jgi:mersacidin/lichenicidin family type 2 lantibiotic
MNIEHIIRAWKSDEDDQNTHLVANPIGTELTDQELQEATGGFKPCLNSAEICTPNTTCTLPPNDNTHLL